MEGSVLLCLFSKFLKLHDRMGVVREISADGISRVVKSRETDDVEVKQLKVLSFAKLLCKDLLKKLIHKGLALKDE